ncbi:dolichyldiphosphatase 1 [Aplysia californica]|uniref:Dolichyldiphosphatase n=1 Tax=Aplysia californica TaxID=6500 RepID=A0ABM0JZ55_APLCA|nr:dolichyldiphosphatase 1 [Aplysia californica]
MADMGTETNVDPDEFNPQDWKAVSLTHVEYPKGDFLGLILAWFSLLPFMLIVSFVTLTLFRRDLHTIAFFAGIVMNEAINLAVKHTVREPRPLRGRQNLYTEYGMPSSHSQFMWFFATYFTLFLLIRLYKNSNIIDDLWKYACGAGGVICAFIVGWSRVYLKYHTVSQVVLGGALGSVMAGLWFALVQLLLTPLFPLIANSPVGELFMLRDSTLIPHVLWFEYTCSRSEARSRQRKMSSRKSQ